MKTKQLLIKILSVLTLIVFLTTNVCAANINIGNEDGTGFGGGSDDNRWGLETEDGTYVNSQQHNEALRITVYDAENGTKVFNTIDITASQYINRTKVYYFSNGTELIPKTTWLSSSYVGTTYNAMESAVNKGAVSLTINETDEKLSITLETVGADIWRELFGIDDNLDIYVQESQSTIEMALDEAGIPTEERTVSLDNLVQLTLFQYFEGFFELPVSGSDLKDGTNGMLSQYGEISPIHRYNRVSKTYSVPEKGITLFLNNGEVPVYANMLDCGNCIEEALIYDVYDSNDSRNAISPDSENKTYYCSAVTIAYIIDTTVFEEEYGFPFPQVDGINTGNTITLFVEYSCLSELEELTELDIGRSVYEIYPDGNILVGYAHIGRFDSTKDFVTGDFSWYHSINHDESYPHIQIKTTFISGAVSTPVTESHHNYKGLSTDFGVRVNPRLWFKGFRTGMKSELFETISAITPK